MGKNVSQGLKIALVEVKAVENGTNVYSCRNCENNSDTIPIVKSRSVEPVIKGRMASPSFIAYIMSHKFVNAMPLYHQQKNSKDLK